jgi:hypothetical protein
MANWKKIIVGTGIGAGIVGIITYVARLNRANAQLESITTANIYSIKTDGLTIRVDVQLKNPSNSTFKIKFPFVKVLYQDTTIGASQVVNKDIQLPAYGEAKIEAIMIKIPFKGVLSLSSGIASLLLKKQPLPIFIKTITAIDLGWKQIPYEKTDKITLTPKA